MFTGFSADIFQFYADLEQNNERDWWAEERWRYDDIVKPTVEAFIEELDERWQPMHIFRPYRSVRFSKDKSPYKTHMGISGISEGGSVHYFHLDGDGLRLAAGMYAMSPDQLVRYRAAVDNDVTGEQLVEIVAELRAAGFEVGSWDPLVGNPRGYYADHPRIDLLRERWVTSGFRWDVPHGWLHSRRALTMVQEAWARSDNLSAWLEEHVGLAEL